MNSDDIIFVSWLLTWLPFLIDFYIKDVRGR